MWTSRWAARYVDEAWPAIALVGMLPAILLVGCVTADPQEVVQNESHMLMGRTQEEVIACAGAPIQEYRRGDMAEVVYYQEASVLEESFPISKSSVPRTHHGCQANVQLRGNRVIGVLYQSIPDTYHDENHCAEIFESCTMLKGQP